MTQAALTMGGSHERRSVKLANTSVTTLVAAGTSTALAEVHAANISASDTTYTLAIYDGTSRFYLANTVTVPARGIHSWAGMLPLNTADTVEVTAGNADRLDINARVVNAR